MGASQALRWSRIPLFHALTEALRILKMVLPDYRYRFFEADKAVAAFLLMFFEHGKHKLTTNYYNMDKGCMLLFFFILSSQIEARQVK